MRMVGMRIGMVMMIVRMAMAVIVIMRVAMAVPVIMVMRVTMGMIV